MTENSNTKPATSKKPTHIAYHVREAGNDSFWNRIGSAWAHADCQGFNIQIETIPLDGRISLRTPPEKNS